MKKTIISKIQNKQFPVFVEKDEDDLYFVECPIFKSCYSQGVSVDDTLNNIREVIELCLEEKENQKIVKSYFPKEVSLHTITL